MLSCLLLLFCMPPFSAATTASVLLLLLCCCDCGAAVLLLLPVFGVAATASGAAVLLCCVTIIRNAMLRDRNPAALRLPAINVQHATVTTQRGMRPNVLLVVSSSLSTHMAQGGVETLWVARPCRQTD